MMNARPHARRRTGSRQSGYSLLNVLVAALIFGFGVLGVVRSVANITSAATQNTNVSTLASLSNAFQGVVQANSAILVDPAFAGGAVTFNSSNIGTAPAALQPWVTQATSALPAAQITITTGPDSASGLPCDRHNGCTVTMQMQWTQVGASTQRSQIFLYRFGQ